MKIKYISGKKFKLSRNKDERWHLIRNLVTQLVTHERIKTTSAKAKHMTPTMERLLAMGKKVVFENRRNLIPQINKTLTTQEARENFFNEIIPRFKDSKGSNTRT